MAVIFISAELILYAIDDGARIEHNFYENLDPTQLIDQITDKIEDGKEEEEVLEEKEVPEEEEEVLEEIEVPEEKEEEEE